MEFTPKVIVDKCNSDESLVVSDKMQSGVQSTPKDVNESSSDGSSKGVSRESGTVSSIKQVQPGHVRPKAIGESYSAEARRKRQVNMEEQKLKRNLLKVQMLKCGDESAPYVCPIIDSHFHYNRLKALVGVRSLSPILEDGSMPSVPEDLVGGVVNYCHGVPVKACLDVTFSFDVQRNLDHRVTKKKLNAMKSLILKKGHCRGIGEIGVDLSGNFAMHLEDQLGVLRSFLEFYVSK